MSDEGLIEAIAHRRGTDRHALLSEIYGDLDWITMTAMEKDRTRRYPSASELAADIRRHLNDEIVSAGRPDSFYRLGKHIARHRAVSRAVAVLLIGLPLLAGALLWIWHSYLTDRSDHARRTLTYQFELGERAAAVRQMITAPDAPLPHAMLEDAQLRPIIDAARLRVEGLLGEKLDDAKFVDMMLAEGSPRDLDGVDRSDPEQRRNLFANGLLKALRGRGRFDSLDLGRMSDEDLIARRDESWRAAVPPWWSSRNAPGTEWLQLSVVGAFAIACVAGLLEFRGRGTRIALWWGLGLASLAIAGLLCWKLIPLVYRTPLTVDEPTSAAKAIAVVLYALFVAAHALEFHRRAGERFRATVLVPVAVPPVALLVLIALDEALGTGPFGFNTGWYWHGFEAIVSVMALAALVMAALAILRSRNVDSFE